MVLFVDDTTMHFVGKFSKPLKKRIIRCLRQFGESVKTIRLTLSPKAVITSSDPMLARAAQEELRKIGFIFNVSGSTADLGVPFASGKNRPSKLLCQSMVKSRFRKQKVAQLEKISRSARKLFSGSVYSSSTWGHGACGVSDTQIESLENDALAAAGITAAA